MELCTHPYVRENENSRLVMFGKEKLREQKVEGSGCDCESTMQ
jgi:hypothetical protein